MTSTAPLLFSFSAAELAHRRAVDDLLSDEAEPWSCKQVYAGYNDDGRTSNLVNEKMLALLDDSIHLTPVMTPEELLADGKRLPATYGEVTSSGARQLFCHMGMTVPLHQRMMDDDNPQDVTPDVNFVDLGSGRGKLVLQAYMELPRLIKSTGIELAPDRHSNAMDALDKLKGKCDKIRATTTCGENDPSSSEQAVMELIEGDMLQANLSEATHIYLSSLGFPNHLMHLIATKLESSAPNLQCVATLRPFPESFRRMGVLDSINYEFVWKTFGDFVHKTEQVEMTWTERKGTTCPVHVYTKVPPFA